jgi:hypothetical protein
MIAKQSMSELKLRPPKLKEFVEVGEIEKAAASRRTPKAPASEDDCEPQQARLFGRDDNVWRLGRNGNESLEFDRLAGDGTEAWNEVEKRRKQRT